MPKKWLFNFTKPLKDLKLGSPSKLYSGKLLLKFESAKNSFVANLQSLCSFLKNLTGSVRNPNNFYTKLERFCSFPPKLFFALPNFKRSFREQSFDGESNFRSFKGFVKLKSCFFGISSHLGAIWNLQNPFLEVPQSTYFF